MPDSLYGRLFKYSPRENQLPIENFLTEGLCDLLNRVTAVSSGACLRFVSEVLGGSALDSGVRDAISNAKNLEWCTQTGMEHAGHRGILDLSLFADEQLVVVVESKVGAGFTTHRISDGNGETEEFRELGQMEFYLEYLAQRQRAAALVLLTVLHMPPGVSNNHRQPSSVRLHLCRWTDIHSWLTGRVLHDELMTSQAAGTLALGLAGELSRFLEDQQLVITEWNSSDLDAMRSFVSPTLDAKLRELFASIRTAVGAMKDIGPNPKWGKFPFTHSPGVVSDWLYCIAPESKWFLLWGITAQQSALSRGYRLVLPEPFQAIVLIGSDKEDIPYTSSDVRRWEKGWKVFEPGRRQRLRLLRTAAFPDAFGQTSFSNSFEEWLVPSIREGAALLAQIRPT